LQLPRWMPCSWGAAHRLAPSFVMAWTLPRGTPARRSPDASVGRAPSAADGDSPNHRPTSHGGVRPCGTEPQGLGQDPNHYWWNSGRLCQRPVSPCARHKFGAVVERYVVAFPFRSQYTYVCTVDHPTDFQLVCGEWAHTYRARVLVSAYAKCSRTGGCRGALCAGCWTWPAPGRAPPTDAPLPPPTRAAWRAAFKGT
jgi:hypothetical protein